MIKIYALVSGQLVLYVGKTIRTLNARVRNHNSTSNTCQTKYIPDYIDWSIKLLEEVPIDQGTIKEQYWYDTLKPLYNHVRPGQTRDEYEQTIAGKQVRIKHYASIKRKEYMKQYRAKKKAERDQS